MSWTLPRNQHLTGDQASALARLCENLTGRELTAFVGFLAPLTLWAINHPDLAEAVMQGARQTDVSEGRSGGFRP
jgi:hypothetical protein